MVQKLYTLEEAMEYLSLSKSSIYRLFNEGKLKRVRLLGSGKKGKANIRITEEAMNDFVHSLQPY